MAAIKLGIKKKIALILALLLFCFLAVIVKLAVVQFVQGDTLQAKAEDLRTRDMAVAAPRGTIYDRNGSKLAISITADSVAVRPPAILQIPEEQREAKTRESAQFLSDILEIDYQEVYDKLTADKYYLYVQRKVDFTVAEQIREADLAGVELEQETQRYYPKGNLAAHVLGFAGVDNQGLYGVELSLENWLVGKDGRIVGEYDANNKPIQHSEYEYIAPEEGYDVYLTIDENIQYFCEKALADLMASESPAKNAGIIIMDPNSGEILAMAIANGYDPNNYSDYDAETWNNFLVNSSYEPGSTFKIITASVAMEEGTVNANSSFFCGGSVQVANARIGCWTSVPHGAQDLAMAVQNSCNPAFVAIGQSIENKAKGLFYKYIRAYGFGETTGIQLQGEANGILQAESNVNQVEIATIAMGQGISVTPIQLITAVCAVANDGVLLKPQLISKVMDGDTLVYEQQPEEVRRVVSADTAKQLREMLVGVVSDGSGFNAAIDGYLIGGKTGTAQKPGDGGYAIGKYIASFVGMVPADNPELVCLVIVDEPQGIYYGSQVAAPIFKTVMTDTLRYLGIAPTEPVGTAEDSSSSTNINVPSVTNLSVASAISELHNLGLNVKLSGSGNTVTAQQPAAGASARPGTTVLLTATDDGSVGEDMVTVPDLSGMRFAEAANILSVLGLSMSADGSGVAISQKPAYGEVVKSGSTISVKFKDDNIINNDIAAP